MASDEFPFINDITMFRDEPFHPVTKEPLQKSSKMSCMADTKYGTGMISCKEKKEKSIAGTIILTTFIIIACIFIFSIQLEFHHVDEIPAVYVFLANPFLIIALIIIAAVIIVAVFKRK